MKFRSALCSVFVVALLVTTVSLPAAATAKVAVVHKGVNPRIALQQYRAAHKTTTKAEAKRSAKLKLHPVSPFERVIQPKLSAYLQAHPASGLTAANSPKRSQAANAPANAATASSNFGGFFNSPSYPGISPILDTAHIQASATADFDKDGHPDVVTVQNDGTVNVLINNGTGGFKAPVTYQDGCCPFVSQVIAADVNGDGYPDVLVADLDNDQIVIYLNQKDGTLAAPTSLSIAPTSGAYFQTFAVGDLNNDGKLDIATLSDLWDYNTNTATVSGQVFLNDGIGNFTTSAQLETDKSYVNLGVNIPVGRSMQLTDLNNDGKMDVVFLADVLVFATNQPVEVAVLSCLGAGDGTVNLQTAQQLDLMGESDENQFANLVVGDTNSDGKVDVAFSDGTDTIYSALGNGDGSFQPAANAFNQGMDAWPLDLALADVYGSGHVALVDLEEGFVRSLPSNNDGTFGVPAYNYVAAANYLPGLLTGHFSGSSRIDLAVVDSTFDRAAVLVNESNGSFIGAFVPSSNPNNSNNATFEPGDLYVLASADLNGDGHPDTLGISYEYDNPVLVAGLNSAPGLFNYINALDPSAYPVLSYVSSVTGDFNNDGRQDFVLFGEDNSFAVALSDGDGTVSIRQILTPPLQCSVNGIATGDVNGDGKLDLILAYGGDSICSEANNFGSGYFTLLGNGDGTFQPVSFTPAGTQLYQPLLADLNGDGNLDLILIDDPYDYSGNNEFTVSVQKGNGDGSFAAAAALLQGQGIAQAIAADFNQDGKQDLILFTEGTALGEGFDANSAGILLYPGNGDMTFADPTLLVQGIFPVTGAFADFNGDGVGDLMVTQQPPYECEGLCDTVEQGSAKLVASRSAQSPVGGSSQFGQQPLLSYGASVLLGQGHGLFGSPISTTLMPYQSYSILTGSFLGDGSTSAVVTGDDGTLLLFNQGGSTVTLTATPGAVNVGSAVMLTETVAPTVGLAGMATGSVTFYDGGVVLGQAALNGSESASFSTSTLAAGTHMFTGVYSGDTNYNVNSATASATVTVTAQTPAIAITAAPASLTLARGNSGQLVFTVTANPTYNGTVTFAASGEPTGVGITFSPASITLTPGQSLTTTMFVTTTSANSAAHSTLAGSMPGWITSAGGVSLAGLLLMVWPRKRTRLPRMLMLFAIATLSLGSLAALSACGGSSYHPAATGASTVVITATPQATGAVAQTMSVSLTIQ